MAWKLRAVEPARLGPRVGSRLDRRAGQPVLRMPAAMPVIAREHDQVVGRLLEITGASSLLEDSPALRLRLSHRNPWIDPLSHLQVELLRRLRAGREEARAPLLATITGIAAGMRNTG